MNTNEVYRNPLPAKVSMLYNTTEGATRHHTARDVAVAKYIITFAIIGINMQYCETIKHRGDWQWGTGSVTIINQIRN